MSFNKLLSHQISTQQHVVEDDEHGPESQRNEFHHNLKSAGDCVMYCENVFKALEQWAKKKHGSAYRLKSSTLQSKEIYYPN